jgi:hypothetical protein
MDEEGHVQRLTSIMNMLRVMGKIHRDDTKMMDCSQNAAFPLAFTSTGQEQLERLVNIWEHVMSLPESSQEYFEFRHVLLMTIGTGDNYHREAIGGRRMRGFLI